MTGYKRGEGGGRVTDERGTPAYIIEAARRVMGTIDLDPASTPLANETVGADLFYTKEDDGLSRAWFGNVWLNPPFSHPLCEQFIDKLISEYEQGYVYQAIVLTNYSTGKWYHRLLKRFPYVQPKHHDLHPNARIEFVPLPPNERGTGNNGTGQTIWYIPRSITWVARFWEVFGEFCTVPWSLL